MTSEFKNAETQANTQNENDKYFANLKRQLEEKQRAFKFKVLAIEPLPHSQNWMTPTATANDVYKLGNNTSSQPANCPKCKITFQLRNKETSALESASFEYDPKTKTLYVDYNNPNSLKAAILFAKSQGDTELKYMGDITKESPERRRQIVDAFQEHGMKLSDTAGNTLSEDGTFLNKEGQELEVEAPTSRVSFSH